MGGGGRRDLVQKFFQPSLAIELGIGSVPSNRFLYSWQFGNAWVSGVLTVSRDSVEAMISGFDTFTSRIQELVRAVHGAAFLFAAGPLSNAAITIMHRINPRNIYVDVGGSLDYVLSNVRTRDFHPLETDESHFVRAGGALVRDQNCTETRWIMIQNGFVPIFSERRGHGIEGN